VNGREVKNAGGAAKTPRLWMAPGEPEHLSAVWSRGAFVVGMSATAGSMLPPGDESLGSVVLHFVNAKERFWDGRSAAAVVQPYSRILRSRVRVLIPSSLAVRCRLPPSGPGTAGSLHVPVPTA